MNIRIELDTELTSARDAAALRALADAIDLAPDPAPVTPKTPDRTEAPRPRFVEVIDSVGDHGIRDASTDEVADFLARPTSSAHAEQRFLHLRAQLAALNAGSLAPEDVTLSPTSSTTIDWVKLGDGYPPYTEATA
ncbi:hypothetical protein J2Y69_003358 [Microbacterium resistens]|uniref:Uncharacterized protein n=1 Tax=Microbacterium resistens TaxID=156977 RepID=A0ABU1SGJ0_9MICO|nr:hypothetical protein [Microbacterium resistens]MDR6868734.1 hypothetical protein [Microbacterium resistens]